MGNATNGRSEYRWYEKGFGLRKKLGSVYHLYRFMPGWEGNRAYLEWLKTARMERMKDTLAAFDTVLAGLTPGSIVLDLGANIGDYTAKLAATGAEVHAFEPEPTLFAQLERRFADTPNVVLHQAAIAAEAGTVQFWPENNEGADPLALMSHSIVEGGKHTAGSTPFEVQCVDFFSFIDSLEQAPALVKMDIEGAEVAILERMFEEKRFDLVGELFVETHESQFPKLQDRIVAIHKRTKSAGLTNVNLFWP